LGFGEVGLGILMVKNFEVSCWAIEWDCSRLRLEVEKFEFGGLGLAARFEKTVI
jgi:hypothetical protein